jgi:hypothetical protein
MNKGLSVDRLKGVDYDDAIDDGKTPTERRRLYAGIGLPLRA